MTHEFDLTEYHRKKISDLADEIRNKVRGGRILGEEIRTDNADDMIVAAYYLAVKQETERRLKDLV